MAISSALGSSALLPAGLGFRNLVMNGAMQVSQRNTTVTGITDSGYFTADRWLNDIYAIGTWTQTTVADAPAGFGNSLKVLCTTANASPIAGALMTLVQRFEGQNLQAIKKGTSSAQSLMISFWVKSNKTGVYVCNLYDNGNNRHVSKSYTVNAVDTWEYKTISIPADTTGTFVNDNTKALELGFWLGGGTNYTSGTLPVVWASRVNANTAAGQTNLASSVNNYFQITGVQMEVNLQPTPFEQRPIGVELMLCQRYYMRWNTFGSYSRLGTGITISSTRAEYLLSYVVPPRNYLGTFSVGGSLQHSDGSAASVIYVLARMDICCSERNYSVYGTSTGLTQYRPMFLEASNSATAYVASDMEL